MDTETLFPVSKLRSRYGIGKQAEINRRKKLNITPTKIGGSYYITQSQLTLLDSLDQHLKECGTLSDFQGSPVSPVESSGLTRPEPQEATLIEQPDPIDLLEVLAERLQPARSPLQNWRELEEAAENVWVLTTKQVHELAGAKPHGTQWERGSFVFSKCKKIGGQTGWLVSKKK